MKGYISKIETLGTNDGPGIRVVIFMSGCPLRCLYCHNPEMFAMNAGKEYSSSELVEYILRYRSYFGKDGGVTFSGGEPLMQYDFLLEVCTLLKKEKIHICLDTCGIGLKNDNILKLFDIVLIDIKYINSEGYKKITNFDYFKESISFMDKCLQYNKKIWFRQVIIPGINANIEYIKELKKFVSKYNSEKIELLPFHTMGFKKYEELNIENKLKNYKDLDLKQLNILNNELNE